MVTFELKIQKKNINLKYNNTFKKNVKIVFYGMFLKTKIKYRENIFDYVYIFILKHIKKYMFKRKRMFKKKYEQTYLKVYFQNVENSFSENLF